MCDYCTKHGAGERWYHNARNYSKELASSNHVRNFCESYFSRKVPPGPDGFASIIDRISQPIGSNEKERVDERYTMYLHHQVVTFQEARRVLEIASRQTDEHERTVVRLPCICRYVAYSGDKDLRCFGIAFSDTYTRRFPSYLGGNHQYISAEEATNILEEWKDTETVVHAVSALGVPYIGMLCNCEMQVCRPYIHSQRLGITSPWQKGHYAAAVDSSKCVGCGTCEEICPFGVPEVDIESNVSIIDPENCHGCGVCTNYCEEHAISLMEYSRPSGY
ncbi:MAG: 4Fe-4S binding protein [Candidatus Thorarchaeota archaeon]